MTASAESTKRPVDVENVSSGHKDAVVLDVENRVADLAHRSDDQADFLRRLARELCTVFELDAVGVTHPQWDTPMVLLSGAAEARRMDGDGVTRILASATSAPTACNVPVVTSDGAHVTARGLHVQLANDVGVSAILLLYAHTHSPSTIDQVRDLKCLAQYAACSREALPELSAWTGQRDEYRSLVEQSPMTVAQSRSLRMFHRDLDLKATAYRITNETRRLLSADRVSLLLSKHGDFRMASVSGVAVVDRRANAVKDAERLANCVAVLDRPISLPSDEPLPPQIQAVLDLYLDETDVCNLLVYPMHLPEAASSTEGTADFDEHTTGDAFALLFIESFSDQKHVLTPTIREVAADATYALANAIEHERIFALPVLKMLGDCFGGRRLRWTTLAVLTFVAMLAASLLLKVDHRIVATGFAEPSIQQNVYARSDGTVKEVFVRDGDHVSKGDRLARLENAELENRAETLSGQLQTTSKRMASIASLLLDPSTDPKQGGRLAIEKRQLESELEGLENQLRLVHQQQDELIITSPIDGTVAGWRLRRKLLDRPLQRGDRLMTVVDLDAEWQLRLEVPEEDAAEVLAAFDEEGTLEVTFAAKSNPRATYAATLDSVATAARKTESGTNIVDALASIKDDAEAGVLQAFYSSQTKTGVEATAKVTCGRRTFLGSWFGDVADFVDRHILFHIR